MFVLLIFSSCNCFYKAWGGKIGIAISVCLSLCAIVSSPYISYGETLKVLLHTKMVMIWGCSWFDPMSFGHVKGHQKKKKLMICVCIIPLLWRNIGCSCLSEDSVTLVKYFFYLFTENEKRCLQYSQSWTISSKIIRNNSEFLLFWTMIIKVYPRFFVKKTKQTEMLHS